MEVFNRSYRRVVFWSAMLAISLQAIVFKYAVMPLLLLEQNHPWPLSLKVALVVLEASGMYFLIYKAFIWSYEKYMWRWRWFLGRYDISGPWYHEFRSSNSNDDYCRLGKTVFYQTALVIHANAVNYGKNFDKAFRTLWNDTSVSMDITGRLVISYVAHTHAAPMCLGKPQDLDQVRAEKKITDSSLFNAPEKTGVMYVTIFHDRKCRPIRMDGIFHDSSPPYRRGTVTWWRSTPWQSKVDDIESLNPEEC